MAAMSQEEILQNTRTVVQGLEALKSEHSTIQTALNQSLKELNDSKNDAPLVQEKATIVNKSLDMIQLGIEEAQVCLAYCLL